MEKMLESLENLLDEVGDSEYEVDYGVRGPTVLIAHVPLPDRVLTERCPDTEVGQPWNVCHQQAAAK